MFSPNSTPVSTPPSTPPPPRRRFYESLRPSPPPTPTSVHHAREKARIKNVDYWKRRLFEDDDDGLVHYPGSSTLSEDERIAKAFHLSGEQEEPIDLGLADPETTVFHPRGPYLLRRATPIRDRFAPMLPVDAFKF